MKQVFLDFDGVLFDTLKEAYLLCRYAFKGTDYFEPVNRTEYERFYRYKFLVFNSWQYYYVMSLLRYTLSDNQFIAEYNCLTSNRNYKAEEDFDKKYYMARKELMTTYNEYWNDLEKPFPFFYKIKEQTLLGNLRPIIVSKKNKSAILYRLNQYGFTIPEQDVYGKDELNGYKTKSEFIKKYMNLNNIINSYFVDDNSNNFTDCSPNITTLLAGWGNIAINESGLSAEDIMNEIT